MSYKKFLYDIYKNVGGKKTLNKQVIFQSDDWGSERIPSKEIYRLLEDKLNLGACPYSRFDTIERINDLEALEEVLSGFVDIAGKSPTFVLNFNVANPNYENIRNSDFSTYSYKSINETYEENNVDGFKMAETIKNSRSFILGYHGREHLNIDSWLKLVKDESSPVRKAFDHSFFALSFANIPSINYPYLASYFPSRSDYKKYHAHIFYDGLELFKEFFGPPPYTFTAPVYIWHDALENVFQEAGGIEIQGLTKQYFSINGKAEISYDRVRNELSHSGLLKNSVRNCFFEPTIDSNKDWVSSTLREIQIAFFMRKPAVICTHRLNYVSGLSINNRDTSLQLLNDLLSQIMKRWPDTRFI